MTMTCAECIWDLENTPKQRPGETEESPKRTKNIAQEEGILAKKLRQYYTLLEQKAIILIFISIIDINVNLSKNEIDKKINLS